MGTTFLISAAVAWIVLGLPAEAWAWGPVTHLVHGALVLESLDAIPAVGRELLSRHPWEYLYGCIGADIFQAKKFTRNVYTHCHHWRTGWTVFRSAEGDAQRAFAWGYLSHLASDTFSHNEYLPARLVTSFRAPAMRHVYWEARFDANQGPEERNLLRQVAARPHPACDELVERVVERTLFSFKTNKRIFDSLLLVQRLEAWQVAMRRLTGSRKHPLDPDEIERFNLRCRDAIHDLLRRRERSACQLADPTGCANLARAARIRRRLRALERAGTLDETTERAILTRLDPLDLVAGAGRVEQPERAGGRLAAPAARPA